MKNLNRSLAVIAVVSLTLVATSVMAQTGDIGGLQLQSTSVLRSIYEWLIALAPWALGAAMVVALLFMRWSGFAPVVWIAGAAFGIASITLILRTMGLTLA